MARAALHRTVVAVHSSPPSGSNPKNRYAIVYFRLMQGIRGVQVFDSELRGVPLFGDAVHLVGREEVACLWRWRSLAPGYVGLAAHVGSDRLLLYTFRETADAIEAAHWPVQSGRPPGGAKLFRDMRYMTKHTLAGVTAAVLTATRALRGKSPSQ